MQGDDNPSESQCMMRILSHSYTEWSAETEWFNKQKKSPWTRIDYILKLSQLRIFTNLRSDFGKYFQTADFVDV